MAEILRGENRYVLAKSEEAWHIFPANHKTHPKAECNLLNEKKSICRKLNWTEAIEKDETCYKEQKIREKCTAIGRPVCGICLSHLYKEVTDEEQDILNS
jgi:hypothetical protein